MKNHQYRGHRTFEIIAPLAELLQIKANTDFRLGEEEYLVEELETRTGVILVAWDVKAIAEQILPRLAKDTVEPVLSTNWDLKRFDVIHQCIGRNPDLGLIANSFRGLTLRCKRRRLN